MTILQKHLVFIPLCIVLFAGLFGLLVMLLWNWLMPALFALPAISYCQAVGLFLLCKLLFGGLGGGHHGHPHGHAHCGDNMLRRRWESMTPEQREQFVEAHRNSSVAPQAEGNGK